MRIGRQASPSANATGTRRNIIRKNMPNRMSAATPGDSTAPVMLLLPRMILTSSSSCSPRNTSQVTPVTGQAT